MFSGLWGAERPMSNSYLEVARDRENNQEPTLPEFDWKRGVNFF